MKNLTYKISLLVLGLFLAAFTASAQKVSGVVTDADGLPLIGVSVIVDGTTIGVSTVPTPSMFLTPMAKLSFSPASDWRPSMLSSDRK